MPSINWKIDLILPTMVFLIASLVNVVLTCWTFVAGDAVPTQGTFVVTDTKLYTPVFILASK